MHKLWLWGGAFLVCGALLMAVPAVAQDGGCECGCYEDECGCGCWEDECGCGGGEEGAGGMGMQPAWMAPSQEHQSLRKFTGDWDSTWKFWMMPGQPPMQGKGKASGKMIMSGFWVEQAYESDFMGTPWTGRWTLGFDTIDKQYVAIWIDSGSPIGSITRGVEKDGAITFSGKDPDHMTGKKKEVKIVLAWSGPDAYSLSFHDVKADGSLVKTGEVAYTRKK